MVVLEIDGFDETTTPSPFAARSQLNYSILSHCTIESFDSVVTRILID